MCSSPSSTPASTCRTSRTRWITSTPTAAALGRILERRLALLHVRADGFDLVGRADQRELELGLELEALGQRALHGGVEELLAGADRVGRAAGDVARVGEGLGARVGADARGE